MPEGNRLLEVLAAVTKNACSSGNQSADFENELLTFLINAMDSNCTVYDAMSLVEKYRM